MSRSDVPPSRGLCGQEWYYIRSAWHLQLDVKSAWHLQSGMPRSGVSNKLLFAGKEWVLFWSGYKFMNNWQEISVDWSCCCCSCCCSYCVILLLFMCNCGDTQINNNKIIYQQQQQSGYDLLKIEQEIYVDWSCCCCCCCFIVEG